MLRERGRIDAGYLHRASAEPELGQWWCGASQESWWQWHSGALGFFSQNSEQNRSPFFASHVQTLCAQTAIG